MSTRQIVLVLVCALLVAAFTTPSAALQCEGCVGDGEAGTPPDFDCDPEEYTFAAEFTVIKSGACKEYRIQVYDYPPEYELQCLPEAGNDECEVKVTFTF